MKPPRPLTKHNSPWVTPGAPMPGAPTPDFHKYMREMDEVVRLLVAKVEDLEIRVNDLENP